MPMVNPAKNCDGIPPWHQTEHTTGASQPLRLWCYASQTAQISLCPLTGAPTTPGQACVPHGPLSAAHWYVRGACHINPLLRQSAVPSLHLLTFCLAKPGSTT
jgi:hypothetical protein